MRQLIDKQIVTGGFFLFVFLFSLYSLTFNGIAQTDDEQLFASVARNIAVHHDFSAGQMFGNTRLQGQYFQIGVFHPFLASIMYWATGWLGWGGSQSMFLLPIFYTALTGVCVFLIGRLQKFSMRASLLAALLFGLGTQAWVYARYFFREPLAMFCLTLACLGLEMVNSPRLFRGFYLLGVISLAGGLTGAIITRASIVFLLPVIAVVGLYRKKRLGKKMTNVRLTKGIGFILVALFLMVIILYGIRNQDFSRFFYRLSPEFIQIVWNRVKDIPHDNFWGAIIGALFSPGKGLFIYSPVLFWVLVNSCRNLCSFLKNGQPVYGNGIDFLAWGALLTQLLTQSLVYDDKWWNVTWGVRYLLPVIPLIIIASFPYLEESLSKKAKRGRLILGVLVIVGFVVQLEGVLITDSNYLTYLSNLNLPITPDLLVWNWEYAPLIGHLKMVANSQPLDIAWIRMVAANIQTGNSLWFAGGTMIVILLAGGFLTHQSLKNTFLSYRSTTGMIFLLAIMGILLPVWAMNNYRDDPFYYQQRVDIRAAERWIQKNIDKDDVIVIRSYLFPTWHYWMNSREIPNHWYSLPIPAQNTADNPVEQIVMDDDRILFFEHLQKQYSRIWLLADWFPSSSSSDGFAAVPLSEEEVFLSQRFNLIERTEFYSLSGSVRTSLYPLP